MSLALIIAGGWVNVLIALIVLGFLYWIFSVLPLPPLAKQIGNIIFTLIAVLILIDLLLGVVHVG